MFRVTIYISNRKIKTAGGLTLRRTIYSALFCLMILLAIPEFIANADNNSGISDKKHRHYNIVIDLNEHKLYLIDKKNNSVVKDYPVAIGKGTTPSPIGTWEIINKGKWSGGFGNRWMGLNVPWGRYGIHGTNIPASVGSSASHGCIRMFNSHVTDLYEKVGYNTSVIIYGGPYGLSHNSFRDLMHGDKGADVYEVQRILKKKNYYPPEPNGIFGDSMRYYVIKFRKDNKLETSDKIDSTFYKKLGIYPFE